MKTESLAMMVAVGALMAFGVDSIWTGASDGCWTNAANWTAGVPGRYYAPDGTLTGNEKETATFAVCNNATTIDLDGVYSIGKVLVTGAGERYTFGTSETQILPLEAIANSPLNTMVVEASVTKAPVIRAILQMGKGSTAQLATTLINNSADEVVVNDFGYPQGTARIYCRFGGSGKTRVDGKWITAPTGGIPTSQLYISTATPAGVWFMKSFDFPGFFNSGAANSRIVIAEGVKIKMTNSNAWGDLGSPDLAIDGLGEMSFDPRGFVQLYTLGTVKLNCKVSQHLTPTGDGGMTFYGRGTYRFNNPENVLSGKFRFWGNGENALVLESEHFGLIGEEGSTLDGISEILAANYLTVRFIGSQPDVTDRVLGIGRHPSWANAQHELRLEQAGSADWTLASTPVMTSVPSDEIFRLYLQGAGTGDGIWTGALKDSANGNLQVTKRGAGRWIYRNKMPYTGDTIIEGGTLALDKGGSLPSSTVSFKGGKLAVLTTETQTLAGVKVTSGVSEIELADGAALVISSLSQSAGTLAVTLGKDATLTCAPLAGQTPIWLTVNGSYGEFDASGKLVKQSYHLTDMIPARGGVIPNGTEKVVGITTAGTDGPITLEKSATTIDTLVQRTDTEAAVSLANGGKLTVGTIAVTEKAAPLTIGAKPGEGILGVKGNNKLSVAVNDAVAPLVINAALDSAFAGEIEKVGEGELRIFSPYTFAGTLKMLGGRVTVNNPGGGTLTGTLVGDRTTSFCVEGSGAYSSPQPQPGFDGDFILNGGRLTMTGAVYKAVRQFGTLAGDLVITNGGQMVLDGPANQEMTMNGKRVRYSGAGADGRGALVSREFFNSMFQRITLDGDTVFAHEQGVVNPGYITLSRQNGYEGLLDMQGHSLKVAGLGSWRLGYFVFNAASITNAGPLRIENSVLAAYPPASLGQADDPPITFGYNAQFSSYAAKPIARPFVVEGTTDKYTEYLLNASTALGDTNSFVHTGSITFDPAEGKTGLIGFSQGGKDTNATVTIAGPVVGNGGFTMASGLRADFNFTYPTNTFTGDITWSDIPEWNNAGYGCVVRFLWPKSLADYAQANCNAGHATVFMPNWTAADVLKFANEAKLKNGATVAVDTTLAKGKEAEIELSDADIVSDNFGLGHEGEGTLAVSGAWTKSPTLVAYGGKLKLTGAGEKTLGATRSQQELRSGIVPELAIEDSGAVTIATNGINVGFGRCGASGTGRVAKMSVRNAKLAVPADTSAYADSYFRVGYGCESGILEVGAGAEIACLPTVGCYYYNVTGPGAGAIWQTGGKVTPKTRTGKSDRFSIGCGTDCWGFYDLADGELDTTGTAGARIAYGLRASGVLQQSGGAARFGILCVGWADQGYASAAYYMTGGTATCTSLQLPYVNWGGFGSRTTFTLDGDCTFDTTGTSNVAVAQGGAENDKVDHGTVTIVNLMNGGKMSVNAFSKGNAYNIIPEAVHAYVNFDGGTLTVRGNYDVFDRGRNAVDAVTSYERGATIGVNAGFGAAISVPVDAPKGRGVASVVWDGEAAARAYIGAPAVDIYGDGYGASAVALFDRASGRVKGIKVLSPGCNYTKAEAVIRPTAVGSHMASCYLTNAVTLTAATPVSGGLRKVGEGSLNLNAKNTYTGATTVEGGVLRLGGDDVIDARSELVLAGGTLDLNGFHAVFGGISGTTGKVLNGAVQIKGDWTVDLSKLTDGNPTELNGAVRFAEGTKVKFTHTDLLDADGSRRRWKVLLAKGGITNPPTLAEPLPAGWTYRANGREIRISRDLGLFLLIK